MTHKRTNHASPEMIKRDLDGAANVGVLAVCLGVVESSVILVLARVFCVMIQGSQHSLRRCPGGVLTQNNFFVRNELISNLKPLLDARASMCLPKRAASIHAVQHRLERE
jgi:hypothetical protein